MGWGHTLRWYGPAIGVSAALFYLSHQPVLPAPPGNDKIAHVIAYTVVGASYLRALYGGRGLRYSWVPVAAFALATLYGVSDELHQTLVPGREASLADLLADAIGAAFGSGVAFLVYLRLGKP